MAGDRILIKDLLVRGVIGINPDERTKPQDILISVTMWADTKSAADTDSIEDAINYRTVSKAIIAHTEQGDPQLVERLAEELSRVCFEADHRIEQVELTVEKPSALRFARSVGVTIRRTRAEVLGE
ncbi:MAG: dihydroneopterin aldolase [Acidimicrobiia bacterium]